MTAHQMKHPKCLFILLEGCVEGRASGRPSAAFMDGIKRGRPYQTIRDMTMNRATYKV